ncbi:MAG: hypothetical protein NVSMB31_18960 [Vulcanimicrobiaceae bacterium]
MLKTTLLAGLAAILAALSTSSMAVAHEHHHFHFADVSDPGLLIGNNDDNQDEDENDDDVVSVAEPVGYYTPIQGNFVAYQPQIVPVNDSVVTPYGYRPVYNNGYYQGYAYNQGYGSNPYYAGAAYGNGDPVTAAVVNTVISAAGSNGHLNGRDIIQTLVGSYLAGQAQRQFQPQYQPQYQQYPQPIYQNGQPVYYPLRGHGDQGENEQGDGDNGNDD